MPSWKVSMRDSMSNQTSHFGIMGGLYNRKVSGRSNTNRVTSRLTIPTGAAAGLKYMKMHNLLSKNPLGSGGVGKVVKSKPCNCGTLEKPLEKPLGKTEPPTEAPTTEHTHLLGQTSDPSPSTNALDVAWVPEGGDGPYDISSLMACTKISLQITNTKYVDESDDYPLYWIGNMLGTPPGYLNFQNNNTVLSSDLGGATSAGVVGDGTLTQQGTWGTATGDYGPACAKGCTIKVTSPQGTPPDINIYSPGGAALQAGQLYYYSGSEKKWRGWDSAPHDAGYTLLNNHSPAAVKIGCGACIPGYHLVNNNTCVLNKCTCLNGTPTTGTACPTNGATICDSCSSGYHPDGTSCVQNKCTCPNGKPATGTACTTDAATICASCNSGYRPAPDGNSCLQNNCKCLNGTVATITACTTDGATICVSCSSGYTLSGETCVENTFTKCPNGKDPFGTPPVFCCSCNKQDTVPSCGGMTAGTDSVPNNDCMCYTHVPTGQDKADITCGGKVPQCGHVHYQTTEHTHLGESHATTLKCKACPSGQTNRGCGPSGNILSPGTCISNNICRHATPCGPTYSCAAGTPPGSAGKANLVSAFGDASNGYFCCDYDKNSISPHIFWPWADICHNIPACAAGTDRTSPQALSCVNYIPDGKDLSDVDCNGTLALCYWPIEGQCALLGEGWQPGNNEFGVGSNGGTGWRATSLAPGPAGLICPPSSCFNIKQGWENATCMKPPT